MRTYRHIHIGYGKMQISARLTTLRDRTQTPLHQGCPECSTRTFQKNFCLNKDCTHNVTPFPPKTEFKKVITIGSETKVFPKEQIDELKLVDKAINILGSIPIGNIDFRLLDGGYYVLPLENDSKKFKNIVDVSEMRKLWKFLQNSLVDNSNGILVNFSVGSNQQNGILLAVGNVIVLYKYAYQENLREVDQTEIDEIESIEISEEEIKAGKKFVESGLKPVDPTKIKNEFNEKLTELILHGKPLVAEQPVVKKKTSNAMEFFKQD